jgi:hypothetical protein
MTGTLHEDQCKFVIIYRSVRLRMRNVTDKICIENQNTHFILNFFKSCLLGVNLEKYCRAGQATDDSRVHAHCVLKN